jgi:hypothetical protein
MDEPLVVRKLPRRKPQVRYSSLANGTKRPWLHCSHAIAIATAMCSIFGVFNPPGESSMRKELAVFASIAALFTFIAFSAQAMPAASLKGASNSGQIIKVAGGCGRGWHRGPYGHCRRN